MDTDFVNSFFSSKSYEEMVNRAHISRNASLANRALYFYANLWKEPVESAVFSPETYLSSDLSAVLYKAWPVLFMGTNKWCEKAWMDDSAPSLRRGIVASLQKLVASNRGSKIILLVIPEKDYCIDQVIEKSKRIVPIQRSLDLLERECENLGVDFIFDEWLDRIDLGNFQRNLPDPDSHLPNVCYLAVRDVVLSRLSPLVSQKTSFITERKTVFGDLSMRLKGQPRKFSREQSRTEATELILLENGNEGLIRPLRGNYQKIGNRAAASQRQSIVILGDSHSSIFYESRLTYLIAHDYKVVDFLWDPMGINSKGLSFGGRDLLLEISLRFLFSD